MTHLLSIQPASQLFRAIHILFQYVRTITAHSLFTIDALAFVACVTYAHTYTHFIFVMCTDEPTFYTISYGRLWAGWVAQLSNTYENFSLRRHRSLWPGIVHSDIDSNKHTHTLRDESIDGNQMFGWMSWDQIPSWSISIVLRWWWRYDADDALALSPISMLAYAIGIGCISLHMWSSMCGTSSPLFQHALHLHQWETLSVHIRSIWNAATIHAAVRYRASNYLIPFDQLSNNLHLHSFSSPREDKCVHGNMIYTHCTASIALNTIKLTQICNHSKLVLLMWGSHCYNVSFLFLFFLFSVFD